VSAVTGEGARERARRDGPEPRAPQ
jgi:hypothetical protein